MYTMGTDPKRVVIREEPHSIAIGFPMKSDLTVADFKANMYVQLLTDGTVSPISAVTQRPLGRVSSTFQPTDKGQVRVVVPIESHLRVKASGTLDENDLAAVIGFDATEGCPTLKTAVAGDWVSAIIFKGGANNNVDCEAGMLRVPFQIPV